MLAEHGLDRDIASINASLPVVTIGVVLAGGKSSRMGRNKAMLVRTSFDTSNHLGERAAVTLLNHMKNCLMAAGCAEVVVSGAAVGGLPDRILDAGPLAGIDSALASLPVSTSPRQMLIVPVDMPALSPVTLQGLMTAAGAARPMHYQSQMLPLVLPITQQTCIAVDAALRGNGPHSIHALVASLSAGTLPLPTSVANEFFNLNTPAEWQAWCLDISSSQARTIDPSGTLQA